MLVKCSVCGQLVERYSSSKATCFECKQQIKKENRHKYKRQQSPKSKVRVRNTTTRSWEEIKNIKRQYRIGCDRDYLLEKYPDISEYIEVEDFLFRLKSQDRVRQRRGHNIFSFENALAQQAAQMLSE